MSKTGKRLIDGLTDLRDTVKRGERLGLHYPTSTWPTCKVCNGTGGRMGMVAWYEQWFDCPDCDGLGYTRQKSPTESGDKP